MKPPLFSVVVLTYNQEHLIRETLDSIYKQSYPNIELIVSDDCSTDGTVDAINKWLKKFGKRFVKYELIISSLNTGISANHTRGVKKATGEYLKYIGGDDILLPEALSKMATFLDINTNVHVATSFIQPFIKKENGKSVETLPLLPEKRFLKIFDKEPVYQFRWLARYCFLPAPGFFFRKDALAKVNYFDEEFKRFEDWHTWLKFLLSGFKIYFLPEITVWWRIHKNSVSTSALYRGDIQFLNEGLNTYYKYVLPNMHLLSALEKIHVRNRVRYYETLIESGGTIKSINKARLNFLFDPIKWIEFPRWIVKNVFLKPRKKIDQIFHTNN